MSRITAHVWLMSAFDARVYGTLRYNAALGRGRRTAQVELTARDGSMTVECPGEDTDEASSLLRAMADRFDSLGQEWRQTFGAEAHPDKTAHSG